MTNHVADHIHMKSLRLLFLHFPLKIDHMPHKYVITEIYRYNVFKNTFTVDNLVVPVDGGIDEEMAVWILSDEVEPCTHSDTFTQIYSSPPQFFRRGLIDVGGSAIK